jgi:hypothetical protein
MVLPREDLELLTATTHCRHATVKWTCTKSNYKKNTLIHTYIPDDLIHFGSRVDGRHVVSLRLVIETRSVDHKSPMIHPNTIEHNPFQTNFISIYRI